MTTAASIAKPQKSTATAHVAAWSDRRFLALTIGSLLLLTSLPYLFAYWSAPPDRQFMGIMLDVPDHGQYFSWMRELGQAPLAANKLTPEPNDPVFFNLLWWGLGRISAATGLGFAGAFHLLRLVAAPLFVLLAYRICGWYFSEVRLQRLALLVILLTSGFGWVLVVLKYTLTGGELLFPLDVFIAEGNTFLGVLAYPHFIAAALYVYVFDLFLRSEQDGRIRYALAAGLVALFLGWQHAYDLVLVYGILGAYLVALTFRDRRIPLRLALGLGLLGFVSWWPALYSVLLTTLNPVWREVLAQFDNAGVFTPNLLHLPILLGPAFLLALFHTVRQRPWRLAGLENRELFLHVWFWANFLLIYIPTDYQIHMLNGWQIPIGILATRAYVSQIAPRVENRFQLSPRVSSALLLALVVPTNLYLFSWRFVDLARHQAPFYLSRSEVETLTWLEENATSEDVVLSSLTVGQFVPAWTGTRAFLAHWAQTLDFYGKSEAVEAFYGASAEHSWRRQLLDDFSVDFVIYGPQERELGGFSPGDADYLQLVHQSADAEVYAVQDRGGAP